jgi:uncharacterized membrane protein
MANGNLNDAVSGNYTLDIGAVFSEAWEKTRGFKLKAWGALILLYLIMFLSMIGLTLLLGVESDEPNHATNAIIQLVVSLIIYPLSAGIMMMSIHQAAGKPVNISMMFGYFHQTLRLFGLYILMTILVFIGILLLVLPGIYLMLAYAMAMPLLIEKNMGIWEAMETSRKAVGKRWFTVFALFLLLGVVCILGAIPLGIGLIWVMPLGMTVMGVTYKTIFGVNP